MRSRDGSSSRRRGALPALLSLFLIGALVVALAGCGVDWSIGGKKDASTTTQSTVLGTDGSTTATATTGTGGVTGTTRLTGSTVPMVSGTITTLAVTTVTVPGTTRTSTNVTYSSTTRTTQSQQHTCTNCGGSGQRDLLQLRGERPGLCRRERRLP